MKILYNKLLLLYLGILIIKFLLYFSNSTIFNANVFQLILFSGILELFLFIPWLIIGKLKALEKISHILFFICITEFVLSHLYFTQSREFISYEFLENFNWIGIKGSVGSPINWVYTILLTSLILVMNYIITKKVFSYSIRDNFSVMIIVISILSFLGNLNYTGSYQISSWKKGLLTPIIPPSFMQTYKDIRSETSELSLLKHRKLTNKEKKFLKLNMIGNHTIKDAITYHPTKIILIMIESLPLSYLHSFNKRVPKTVTPFLNQLISKNLIYTNYYTSGFPTDNGLSATLCSIPYFDIKDKFNNKYCLPQLFNLNGYKTLIYRGVSLLYRNHQKLYPKIFKFDEVMGPEELNLEKKWNWGAKDHDIFNTSLTRILKDPQEKIFITINTMDTHPPYLQDIKEYEEPLFNALKLTDKNLKVFINKLEKSQVWNDTLLILTSDHSPNHGNYFKISGANNYNPAKIPLFFLGSSPLTKKLNTIPKKKIISQLDLLPTFKDIFKEKDIKSYLGSSMFSSELKKPIIVNLNGKIQILKDHQYTPLNFGFNTSINKEQTNLDDVSVRQFIINNFIKH